jgi:putative hydrolase of the HAD superfamily
MKNIAKQVVLFDFDGTLGYMLPTHKEIYQQAIKEFGIDLKENSLKKMPIKNAWLKWMTHEGISHLSESESSGKYKKLRKDIHAERIKKMGVTDFIDDITERIYVLESNLKFYFLYDDVIETLEDLKTKNIKMGIVSNHLWNLDKIINNLKIADFFEIILSSAQVGYRKPHHNIYKDAIKKMQTTTDEALFIGDDLENDYYGPKQIGIDAILIDRKAEKKIKNSINSLKEIHTVVFNNQK